MQKQSCEDRLGNGFDKSRFQWKFYDKPLNWTSEILVDSFGRCEPEFSRFQ